MEDWNGGFTRSEDLEEEEVWAMMNAREGSNSTSKTKKKHFSTSPPTSSSSSSAWRSTTAPPRSISGGGVNQGFSVRTPSSAPVDIPDWPKILRIKSNKNPWNDEYDVDGGDERRSQFCNGENDDGDEIIPPHEYLARRLAATQIASFSMCEGVGRTLKGRDLSKLRNAILTKTGFLE